MSPSNINIYNINYEVIIINGGVIVLNLMQVKLENLKLMRDLRLVCARIEKKNVLAGFKIFYITYFI